MTTFTASRRDLEQLFAKLGVDEDSSRLADWSGPHIRIDPKLGCYIVEAWSTTIYFCPWCGAKLPRPSDATFKFDPTANAGDAKNIIISVDFEGNVCWNGERLRDRDELQARLKSESGDNDDKGE